MSVESPSGAGSGAAENAAATSMDASTVGYGRVGAAALVTIRRPERRNSLDGDTAAAMVQAIRTFEQDPDARVLVVTGDDDAFCAGADLKSLDSLQPRVGDQHGVFGTRCFAAKPTIAAISGWCLGGGVSLATWCDLRVAAETAHFGFPDRKWGAPILDGGTDRLAAIVGLGRALELVLTGRDVAAAEALSIGLVNEVVPAGCHVARAMEIAEMLAGFPQATLLADRRALLEPLEAQLAETAQRDLRTLREVAADAAEASRRFSTTEAHQ